MLEASLTAPTKRACDCCHRRKVKCIGEGTNPCKKCIAADLNCTYNAIPQKKGPKGSRAKVLSNLRESQRNAVYVTGYPQDLNGFLPGASARTPGLVTDGLVQSCLEFFFTNVYASEPILHREKAQEAAQNMNYCTETYSMIVALCAYVLIQANMPVPNNVLTRPDLASMSNMSLGHVLLEESVRVRTGIDYREEPTHITVLTSWLYYGCYFGLGSKENTAWLYLREATTHAQLLGMHDEETYKHDPLDISRRRVLYWILFIEERMYALHKHHPITLYPTIQPPSLDEGPEDKSISVGLGVMITLFKTVDGNLWNRVPTQANSAWISELQTRLSEAVPTSIECTEAQAVQIWVTKHWLRAMVWQLSSGSNDPSMTFKFPIEMSRDLLEITKRFTPQSMEIHGAKLTVKLLDVACCLADIGAIATSSSGSVALGLHDYIARFFMILSTLRGGGTRYSPALWARLPDALRATNSTIDISSTVYGMTTISSPSTGLICGLAAQTGAQLPFESAQQPGIQIPINHVEDWSPYYSAAQNIGYSVGVHFPL